MNSIQTRDGKQAIALDPASTMRLLPHAYPFVLLDRVLGCDPEAGSGHSIKNITLTDPVLAGHFPGHPIYPGVLIIEAMAQNALLVQAIRALARELGSLDAVLAHLATPSGVDAAGAAQYFLAESRVKHTRPVYPGDRLDLRTSLVLERATMMAYKVSASVDGQEVARGQVTMATALADPTTEAA